METIAQGKGSPFNLQVMIPEPVKRELRIFAQDLRMYQRDVATVAIKQFLRADNREEAIKLMKRLRMQNTKATARNGKGLPA